MTYLRLISMALIILLSAPISCVQKESKRPLVSKSQNIVPILGTQPIKANTSATLQQQATVSDSNGEAEQLDQEITVNGVIEVETNERTSTFSLTEEVITLSIITASDNEMIVTVVEKVPVSKNGQFTLKVPPHQTLMLTFTNSKTGRRSAILPALEPTEAKLPFLLVNELTTSASDLFEILATQKESAEFIKNKVFDLFSVYKTAFALKNLEDTYSSAVISDSIIKKAVELLLKNNRSIINACANSAEKLTQLRASIHKENLKIFNILGASGNRVAKT